MSKSDSMRAMREANYAARAAQGTSAPRPAARPAPVAATAAPTASSPAPAETTPAAAPAAAAEALCGHRNMGGRTCTRELGHAAKSHRYS